MTYCAIKNTLSFTSSFCSSGDLENKNQIGCVFGVSRPPERVCARHLSGMGCFLTFLVECFSSNQAVSDNPVFGIAELAKVGTPVILAKMPTMAKKCQKMGVPLIKHDF